MGGEEKEKKKKKEAKLVDEQSVTPTNGHAPVANGVDPAAYEKTNDALREQEKRAKKAEAAAQKYERRVQELEQQLASSASGKSAGNADLQRDLAAARADASKYSGQLDDLKVEI